MTIDIDIDTFLQSSHLPIVDVRSPGEFLHGHIPGATNIPLFDDAQRAEVGTIYKQRGRQEAIVRGLQCVGANAERLWKSFQQIESGPDLLVHCWRGGMRSEGIGWFLNGCEYRPRRLQGGYKAFRHAAHQSFAEPRRIIILAGASGAGKTRLLCALQQQGQQVIDLENLARHRGSVFGGIHQPEQPTVEQFENDLFLQWRDLDPDRPVWIECESQSIGRVFIPKPVWNQMTNAAAIYVEVDRQRRVEFLIEEYGDLPHDELAQAISKIKKRLGGARLTSALNALQRNDLQAFTEIALDYYDKAYHHSHAQHPRERNRRIPLAKSGDTDSIAELIRMGSELTGHSHLANH